METGPYLLERVDAVAGVHLYADGFNPIDLREKMLIWHLYHITMQPLPFGTSLHDKFYVLRPALRLQS